ncbi:MAG: hypothetical protein K0B05_01790 [Bacteroidales bacterium]|nr:hypothetical protein [Bacteroidales bacterium]
MECFKVSEFQCFNVSGFACGELGAERLGSGFSFAGFPSSGCNQGRSMIVRFTPEGCYLIEEVLPGETEKKGFNEK